MADEVTPPPVIEEPAAPPAPVITPEMRAQIVMEEISARPDDFRNMLGVQQQVQNIQQPTTEPDGYENDEYARGVGTVAEQRVERRLRAEYDKRFEDMAAGFTQMVAPALVDSGINHVKSHVKDFPVEAEPYLRAAISKIPPNQHGQLNADSARFLTDSAIGQAFREGKFKDFEVTSGEPAGGRRNPSIQLAEGITQSDIEGYARMIGKKADDPKVLESLKKDGFIK